MVFGRVASLRGPWREEFDRHFSDLLGTWPARLTSSPVFPALNVWEVGDNLYAEAELPGVKQEELEISVAGGELTIKGQREFKSDDRATFHRRERAMGEFTRVLRLPVEVDSERVEASLKDGVLLITLPKHEAAKPRKIEVKVNG
jgi:HSP20 family protein